MEVGQSVLLPKNKTIIFIRLAHFLSSHSDTYLKEVLHALSIVAVGFTTDSFNFFDLSRLAGSLNVLEVDFRILAEIDDRAQEVEQTFEALKINASVIVINQKNN